MRVHFSDWTFLQARAMKGLCIKSLRMRDQYHKFQVDEESGSGQLLLNVILFPA